MQRLKQLWVAEKLLCKNKECLHLMMNGFIEESVKTFVWSHVKRLKVTTKHFIHTLMSEYLSLIIKVYMRYYLRQYNANGM